MGRDVSMAWLSDSYDEIVDSLGEAGSNAGGGGFARLASTIIGKLIRTVKIFFVSPLRWHKKNFPSAIWWMSVQFDGCQRCFPSNMDGICQDGQI